MTQSQYKNQNLRNHSFQNQNLSDLDFSNADIRGACFKNAILVRTNFSKARAGLAPLQSCALIAISFVLIIISGLAIGYSSAFPALIDKLLFENNAVDIEVLVLVGISSLAGFIFIIIRQGLGVSLSAFAIVIAIMTAIIAFAIRGDGTITAAAILQAVVIAMIMASVLVASVAHSLFFSIAGTKALILSIVVALAIAVVGAQEGIKGTPAVNSSTSLALTYLLSMILIILSVYISNKAILGDSRYKLIRAFPIVLCATLGTSFREANLTAADFTQAQLKATDFRNATLTRTRWYQAQGLDQASTWGAYLGNPILRNLVITGQGQDQNFDNLNLQGVNLRGAQLSDASFISANLSNADLQDADLSRAKLVKAQLYNTRLNRACLTGANIQDWAIALDTQFDDVRCDYVYMHLPTPEDQDPYRKPDNRDEIFAPGDFADFITPIIKTLDLYKQQNVDPRQVANTYKTIDLFHHDGIDPSAAAVALKRLADLHPEAGLEVVALEGRGNEKVRLQARVSSQANPSELSKEYFEQYGEVKDLSYGDLQSLLRGIEEKDSRIRSLEAMVTTAIQQKSFYVETYQNMGDTVTEKSEISISAGGDIGSVSGIVGGDVSGVMNLGTISGNVTNAINGLPEDSDEKAELKSLLKQLQDAIEAEPTLESDDKAEALEQVQTLAKAGQNPQDSAMQKAAKTAMKILKGTTTGLSETTKLVGECAKLLPAISSLLLLL